MSEVPAVPGGNMAARVPFRHQLAAFRGENLRLQRQGLELIAILVGIIDVFFPSQPFQVLRISADGLVPERVDKSKTEAVSKLS